MIAQNTQLVTITINGIEIEVPKGELIVEAVKRIGGDIPIFCYHPRMKPVGMCRMCFVELGYKQQDGSVRMMPKPQTACTLPADENMVILTDTEQVRKDRRGVLEFLLINHPLDCPICDRGGECPLQNNTLFYGPSTTRFIEVKRHLPKAFPLSQYVTLDLERCIQCGRCVRFTEEISGDSQLAFLFRGAQMQPQTFQLTDFSSKFSGNVIEICPVGALTSSEYRFRARPWDLETKPSICLECSNGCNVWFDYRVGSLVRINGRVNNAVNEEWTCDRGKFGQNYLNSSDRLTTVLKREEDILLQSDWGNVYELILSHFRDFGDQAAALIGPKCSNEDIFSIKRFFTDVVKSQNIDHRWTKLLPNQNATVAFLHGIHEVNLSIADFEKQPVIFVLGDVASELPILYLRVRKAWSQFGAKIIVLSDRPTYADAFAHTILRCKSGSEIAVIGTLLQLLGGNGLTLEEGAQLTGITKEIFEQTVETLKDGFATIASRHVYNLPNGDKIASALANLSIVCNSSDRFNLYAIGANDQGATEIGFLPTENGLNTRQIFEGCKSGTIRSLWIFHADPFELWHDKHEVEKALESVEFLVVQDILKTKTTDFASVVLPCCAFSEMDGTYTNLERRVQQLSRIISPKGNAKPAWKTFSELLLRNHGTSPQFSAKEVFAKLVESNQHFAPATSCYTEKEGVLLAPQETTSPKLLNIDYKHITTEDHQHTGESR
jgi:NADH-quinone oxidoreductase subunit G